MTRSIVLRLASIERYEFSADFMLSIAVDIWLRDGEPLGEGTPKLVCLRLY